MCPQIACLRRGIVALVAFVWLFSTVNFQMFPQIACMRLQHWRFILQIELKYKYLYVKCVENSLCQTKASIILLEMKNHTHVKKAICTFCCVGSVGTWSQNTYDRGHKRKSQHWLKRDSFPGAFLRRQAAYKLWHNKNRKMCRPPSPYKARGGGWDQLALCWSLCLRGWSWEWSRSISSSPHRQGLKEKVSNLREIYPNTCVANYGGKYLS